MKNNHSFNLETAVLGGGCFWCIEPIFSHTKGVVSVMPGYAGGKKDNPTYEEISTGETRPASTRGNSSTRGGHAEVIEIKFDPNIINYEELLHIFFSFHDPTTLNRQGNDVGTQYRSIVFYGDEKQKQSAKKVIKELEEEKIYKNPIITQIEPLEKFWAAEEYHKKYFENHPEKNYCQIVIAPKIAKFRKKYSQYYIP
jgi:peptide-methionine (S)-S-oxide reductase